jgi:putative sterol carrier protein
MGDRSRSGAEARFDATSEFFDELRRRGRDPLLGNATGSVRFDLARGAGTDHWLVALSAGDATVSRANAGADCVVQADQALFDLIARGDVNPMAALLRGELTAEGDLELLMRLQRLFPGPPESRRHGRQSVEGPPHG